MTIVNKNQFQSIKIKRYDLLNDLKTLPLSKKNDLS